MITKQFDLDDTFLMSEIIEKMDLNIAIDKYMNAEKALESISALKSEDSETEMTEEEQENELAIKENEVGKKMMLKIGVDIGVLFLKRMHKAKKEIKQLISNLTGKTVKEVAKMNIKEIKQFFEELVKEEDFADFLSSAEE